MCKHFNIHLLCFSSSLIFYVVEFDDFDLENGCRAWHFTMATTHLSVSSQMIFITLKNIIVIFLYKNKVAN